MAVGNKVAGEVTIILDEARTLIFDTNACIRFQEAYGCSINALFMRLRGIDDPKLDDEERGIRFLSVIGDRELQYLLWAALLRQSPKLELDDVIPLMEQAEGDGQFGRQTYILGKVLATYAATIGEDAKKKALEIQEARLKLRASKNGIGGRSAEGPSPSPSSAMATASGASPSGS